MSLTRRLALAGLALAAAGAVLWSRKQGTGAAEAATLYAKPLSKPKDTMKVYHLGHSLVGRNMPAMLAQLARTGHAYDSQLGWGTSLKEHWEPDAVINGFAEENAHDRFRPVAKALMSAEYDAVVLTEMVALRDAIRTHDSAKYLARWASLARLKNPKARVYLYETWHHLNDLDGWLARLDSDLPKLWYAGVLHPALALTSTPIHLIPAGQVMAAFVRKIEAAGGIGGITVRSDLFAMRADGTPDTIHFNDIGAYLVALTHYAVLYHRTPVGLPHQLLLADGTAAQAPSKEAARAMQETVWQVVRQHPETGVAA